MNSIYERLEKIFLNKKKINKISKLELKILNLARINWKQEIAIILQNKKNLNKDNSFKEHSIAKIHKIGKNMLILYP